MVFMYDIVISRQVLACLEMQNVYCILPSDVYNKVTDIFKQEVEYSRYHQLVLMQLVMLYTLLLVRHLLLPISLLIMMALYGYRLY